jgi:hypothetical protein
VIGRLEQEKIETLAQLPQVQRETTAMLARVIVEQVQQLRDEQVRTWRAVEQLQGAA